MTAIQIRELIALGSEWERLHAVTEAAFARSRVLSYAPGWEEDEEKSHRAIGEEDDLADRIAGMTPTCLAGALVQVRVARQYMRDSTPDDQAIAGCFKGIARWLEGQAA